jgi:acid phosphatase (class A)
MRRRTVLLAAAAVMAAAGLAKAQPAPAVSKFLAPGDLDVSLLLPPPSRVGSPAEAAERAELHRLAAERTPERLAQARHDDEVEDVTAIAEVLGPAFDLKRFPATAKLFADLRYEDGVAAKAAKAYFHRDRPFQADTALDVCDDGHDAANAYPSGHATMGFAAATVLANLMPGNAQLILARASDYAESRLYCGVHYRSDTTAAMTLANVMVVRLTAKPAFAAELEAARAELTTAHIAP